MFAQKDFDELIDAAKCYNVINLWHHAVTMIRILRILKTN
jgi:hypothetical protein